MTYTDALLDQYEVIQATNGLIGWLCRRCTHIAYIARDLTGDQTGLTLAEMAEQALDHEQEHHT